MRMSLVLAALLAALPALSATAWEHIIPGAEASAVLFTADGDVVSAGWVGDSAPYEMAVMRHSAADGAEKWRYSISSSAHSSWNGLGGGLDTVSLVGAPSGTFVVATASFQDDHFVGSVVKLSGDGAELWRSDPVEWIGFRAISVDADGDIIVGGSVSSSTISPIDLDLIILKLSGQTGTELWRRVIEGTSASLIEEWTSSLAVDASGDVFVGGDLLLNAPLDWPDFFVVKLAGENGGEIWRNRVASVTPSGRVGAIAVTPDQDLVAAGWAVPGNGWCDFVVTKFDGSDGTERWRNVFDGAGNCDYALGLAVDGVGDAIATGNLGNEFVTVKIDGSLGSVDWLHSIPNLSPCTGGECAAGKVVRIDAHGYPLVVGWARGPQDYDMTAALLDKASGSPIWLSRLDVAQSNEGAFAADINGMGDVVLGGCTYSTGGKQCTGQTFAVVKLFGDFDGDGIKNDVDNCRDDPNLDQADADQDGVGDVCEVVVCGDGVKDASEECDGGTSNSDSAPNACRRSCVLPRCGDAVVDSGEQCDEGAANSDGAPNACRESCNLPISGDGVIDSGEQCDDGGNLGFDGCSAGGEIEGGFVCSGQPSECSVVPSPQGKYQQKCIVEMNKNAAKLAAAWNSDAANCMQNASSGKVDKLGLPATAQGCLTNDVKGQVQRALKQLVDRDRGMCLASVDQLPVYAYRSSAAISAALGDEALGLTRDLFGPDLGGVVVPGALDQRGARCQLELKKGVSSVFGASMDGLVACKTSALSGKIRLTGQGPVESLMQLQNESLACLDLSTHGSRGKIYMAIAKLRSTLVKTCGDPGVVTPLRDLAPGCGSVNLAGLMTCAETTAECRFCKAANATDGFGIDCDVYDDGVSNLSCR